MTSQTRHLDFEAAILNLMAAIFDFVIISENDLN